MGVITIQQEDSAALHVEKLHGLARVFNRYVLKEIDINNSANFKDSVRSSITPSEGLDNLELEKASEAMDEEILWCKYNVKDPNGSFEVLEATVDLGESVLRAANAIPHPGYLATVYLHNIIASEHVMLFTVAAIEEQQVLTEKITDPANKLEESKYRFKMTQHINETISRLGRIDRNRIPWQLSLNRLTELNASAPTKTVNDASQQQSEV